MDEEKMKNSNEPIQTTENEDSILNGPIQSGRRGLSTAKGFIKKAVTKEVIKWALRIVPVFLIIIIVFVVVLQPLFTIYNHVKNMTLINMGQTLPNADSSTYTTTSGIFGKIAGGVISGLKELGTAILRAIRNRN